MKGLRKAIILVTVFMLMCTVLPAAALAASDNLISSITQYKSDGTVYAEDTDTIYPDEGRVRMQFRIPNSTATSVVMTLRQTGGTASFRLPSMTAVGLTASFTGNISGDLPDGDYYIEGTYLYISGYHLQNQIMLNGRPVPGTGVRVPLYATGSVRSNMTIKVRNGALPGGGTAGDDDTGTTPGVTGGNWSKDSAGKYTYTLDGKKQTGWQKIDGEYYLFDGSGIMQTGWKQSGNKWYYLESSGAMKTGWLNDNGTWYYLKPGNGDMAVGWAEAGGVWYYFEGSGKMTTGWKQVGGTWYYLKSSGAMKTGWHNDGGTWYYLQSSGAMKANGWQKDGSDWYYMTSSGAMKTGWQKDGSDWYYLASSGAMHTGWLQNPAGTWYYLTPGSGKLAIGTRTIDGVSYTFNTGGVWVS